MFTQEQEIFLAEFADKELKLINKSSTEEAVNQAKKDREEFIVQLEFQKKTELEAAIATYDQEHQG